MAVPVKTYFERYKGMPQLDDNWGDMTTMLDAVLVNGFNPVVVTSLTRIDQIVTAAAVAHGYEIDQCVTLSGADQTEYNGEFLVLARTTDSFTYSIVGSPTTPATTGTAMGAIASPMGYEIVASATRRRCYRSKKADSNRKVLVVDDSMPAGYTTTWAKFARVAICESVSDAYTMNGSQAPYDAASPNKSFTPSGSGGSLYSGWFKWYYCAQMQGSSDTTTGGVGSRHFTLIGDNMSFWFFVRPVSPTLNWNPIKAGYAFGEWPSFKTADPYNTVLIATDGYVPVTTGMYIAYYNYFAQSNYSHGKVILRDFSGFSPSPYFSPAGFATAANQVSGVPAAIDIVPFPNGPGGSLVLTQVYCRETNSGTLRGTWPGLYHTPHDRPLTDRSVVENVPSLPGRKIICIEVSNAANNGAGANINPRVFVDITGPWRA